MQQRLRHYARPKLLCIEEIGYLSYDARAADLLFEIVTRRYQRASTIISTNKPFADWHEIFPNASSVVTLIDRLTHQAEILQIEGESYRLKESRDSAEKVPRQKPVAECRAGAETECEDSQEPESPPLGDDHAAPHRFAQSSCPAARRTTNRGTPGGL